LRRLQREQDPKSNWVFTTEKGGPFTPDGFNKFVKRLGEGVLPFSIHAHMLRHSTGYHLADRDRSTRLIQDYLGHRSIASTVRYTELSPTKFKNINPLAVNNGVNIRAFANRGPALWGGTRSQRIGVVQACHDMRKGASGWCAPIGSATVPLPWVRGPAKPWAARCGLADPACFGGTA
jgi:hypothetical protein